MILTNNVFDFHVHCGWTHNMYHNPNDLKNLLQVCPQIKGCLCSSLSGIFDYATGRDDLFQALDISNVVGCFWVNPYLPKWADKIKHDCFNKQFLSSKIPCIELSPTANQYEPTEKFLKPVWQFCQDNEKFIVIHTDSNRNRPDKLIPLLEKFPDVAVVLCYLGTGPINICIAKLFRQVYLETSFDQQTLDFSSLKHALDILGPDRLLFGSNYPLVFSVGRDKKGKHHGITAKRLWQQQYIHHRF